MIGAWLFAEISFELNKIAVRKKGMLKQKIFIVYCFVSWLCYITT